jgi:hypothetical protein
MRAGYFNKEVFAVKSDFEILQDQSNARMRATMGGASPGSTPQSSAIVVEGTDGKPIVKRRWKIGDPWTTSYYYADWRNDEL